MAKENKAFVGTWLPKDVHHSLNIVASKMGKHITDLAAELIEGGLLEQIAFQNGTGEYSPELALAEAYIKMRKQEQARFQLVSLMINVIQSPTDDRQLDELVRLCEENGFHIDEIRQQAQDMTRVQTSGIFNLGDNDTQTDRAINFLSALFKETNSIPTRDIEAKAAQLNISPAVLKLAKRHLSLVSVRKGAIWYWELPFLVAPRSVDVQL